MVEFVWIIRVELESLLGKRGVSDSYVIPFEQARGCEERLGGSRIWFVLRGDEDRCVVSVVVRCVERIDEGYYKGDCLVSTDVLKSFRLSSDYRAATLFRTDTCANFGTGISEFGAGDVLRSTVLQGIVRRIFRPPNSVFDEIKWVCRPKTPLSVAKVSMAMILRHFALDQVWSFGFGNRNAPFSFFAKCFLEINGVCDAYLMELLNSMDPIAGMVSAGLRHGRVTDEQSFGGRASFVDVSFFEIDPDKLVVRKFVPARELDPGLEASAKTEAAEKSHQEMVRDIAMFLKTRGIVAFESTSVDLVFWIDGATNLVEVKSATGDNVLAQAAKGVFQVTCYYSAMERDYADIRRVLVLEGVKNEPLEAHIHRVSKCLGVTCLFYDRDLSWPGRVSGLLFDA